LIPGRVNTKAEILTIVASLVSLHHLRNGAVLLSPLSVGSDWVGYHVDLRHGTLVCCQFKTRLESGPVTEI